MSICSPPLPQIDQSPVPAAPTARPHLPHLDALRAAAVIMVVGFHLYGETYKWGFLPPHWIFGYLQTDGTPLRYLFAPFALGYAGVPLFFVLSGFCIHYAFLRSKRPFVYGRFMWRRAWRIYPAYLAAIVFALLINHDPISSLHHLPKTLLLHVAMLHNFVNHQIYELNPAFWTLPVEFQFYAMYPLFLWMRKHWGVDGAAAATVGLSLTLVAVMWAYNKNTPIWVANPLTSWGQWCLGAAIAERILEGRPVMLPLGRVLIICVPLIVLTSRLVYWEWSALLWAVIFASVMDVWLRRDANWLPRWFCWIGAISYSIYLLHQPLILRLLWYVRGSGDLRFAKMLLISLPLILVLSTASYYLFELPGMRIGHRKFPARSRS